MHVRLTTVAISAMVAQFLSCSWHSENGNEEHEILVVQQGVNCGVERWPVKTGTDVGSVNMTPQDTTIASLGSLPRPSTLPQNRRAATASVTIFNGGSASQ